MPYLDKWVCIRRKRSQLDNSDLVLLNFLNSSYLHTYNSRLQLCDWSFLFKVSYIKKIINILDMISLISLFRSSIKFWLIITVLPEKGIFWFFAKYTSIVPMGEEDCPNRENRNIYIYFYRSLLDDNCDVDLICQTDLTKYGKFWWSLTEKQQAVSQKLARFLEKKK